MVCFSILLMPGLLQAQTPPGMSVTCDNGASFENGVEVIISQMRSGFTYTATAVGLNDFDPVLAVLDTETLNGLCSDDSDDARRYAADLPTTGEVSASGLSAQVTFDQNSSSVFADVSLVVGGFNNQSGEFLLILEGMAATSEDGAGDAFKVNLTPGMVASDVPLTVYMITRGQSTVDPLTYLADEDLNMISDSDGVDIYCDDAGDSDICYTPMDISESTVTIATGSLPTWDYDAVLSLDISGVELDEDPMQNYLTYVMTSYQQESEGQYLLVFHIGITEDVPTDKGGNGQTGGGQTSGGG
jgi:hypothetical protein